MWLVPSFFLPFFHSVLALRVVPIAILVVVGHCLGPCCEVLLEFFQRAVRFSQVTSKLCRLAKRMFSHSESSQQGALCLVIRITSWCAVRVTGEGCTLFGDSLCESSRYATEVDEVPLEQALEEDDVAA
ncbi:hypothetical protein LR48_Vigan02g150500 [Vigna angularis]|uniref:Secreted protein n=1 Tax=Phaseolus angularis TaxID=3914 RepID=A0A0L9TXS9_PHAAN|nr:hypothetical protein LR48_Vigan02g150500 [Vigna angularis]